MTDKITVTQADKDASADLTHAIGMTADEFCNYADAIVQAFAAHRFVAQNDAQMAAPDALAAELAALDAKATPGPWDVVEYNDAESLAIHDRPRNWRVCFMATPGSIGSMEAILASADLIVALRNNLPAILASLSASTPPSSATAAATPSPDTGGESPAPDGLAAKLVRLCCEVELRFTGQFCEQLVNALSAAAAALSASNTPHLTHIIDRDRYIVAMSLGHIREGLNGHRWLLEGRGPYEWDDDRYRDEFRAWLESVERATGALAKLAFDKADCTTDPALVAKAQEAARAYVAEAPKGHREMLPSDLGLPCPSCAAAAKRPVTQGSTLEPDDLLPSYCHLIDALQSDDPDAVDTAFQASIEAVTKFGLLRASMNPTDMHSDGMNLP